MSNEEIRVRVNPEWHKRIFGQLSIPISSGRTIRFRRYSKLDKLKGRLVDMFKRKDEIKELKETINTLFQKINKLENEIQYNVIRKMEGLTYRLDILQALNSDIDYRLIIGNADRQKAVQDGYKLVGFSKSNDCEVWAKK